MQTTADAAALAPTLSGRLERFLAPLLLRLDRAVDRRLVKTFAATISILLEQRYRASGLLLSELGAFLAGAEHAPAGTKRLSNLLRSPRWTSGLLHDFLWSQADARLRDLVCRDHDALLLWDESVLEKPESIALEGLSSVRSAQAQRLKRIRKGYYQPPAGVGPPSWTVRRLGIKRRLLSPERVSARTRGVRGSRGRSAAGAGCTSPR